MKVSLYDWDGDCKGLPSWFQHLTIAEVSWEQIQELFDTGHNVKLIHGTDGLVILYVSAKDFSQR